MNQRLTRKEMKQRRVRPPLWGGAVDYAEQPRPAASSSRLVGVLVLGALLLGGRFLAAAAAPAKPGNALAGPIGSTRRRSIPTAPKPDDPEKPDLRRRGRPAGARQERCSRSCATSTARTEAGDVAAVYLARSPSRRASRTGPRALAGLPRRPRDHLLAGETRVSLLHLDRQQGKGEQVVAELRAHARRRRAAAARGRRLWRAGRKPSGAARQAAGGGPAATSASSTSSRVALRAGGDARRTASSNLPARRRAMGMPRTGGAPVCRRYRGGDLMILPTASWSRKRAGQRLSDAEIAAVVEGAADGGSDDASSRPS